MHGPARHWKQYVCHRVIAANGAMPDTLYIVRNQGVTMVRLEFATKRSQNLRVQLLRKLGEWGRFVRGVAPAPFHLTAGIASLIHCQAFALLVAVLFAMSSTGLQASSTTITINITIVEVQCTAEQRSRIRACAPAQEIVTTEPSKVLVSMPSANGAPEMRYEIRLHPERPVWIKTVLY